MGCWRPQRQRRGYQRSSQMGRQPSALAAPTPRGLQPRPLGAGGWGGEFLREKGESPSKGEYSGPRLGPLFSPSERHPCWGKGRGALSKGQDIAVAGFLLLFNSYHLHKYTQGTF